MECETSVTFQDHAAAFAPHVDIFATHWAESVREVPVEDRRLELVASSPAVAVREDLVEATFELGIAGESN
jgi:hypothetical protein